MKKIVMTFLASILAASVYAADSWQVFETTGVTPVITLRTGAGHLYKVIVSSAGTGSTIELSDSLVVYDDALRIAVIDTTAIGEHQFDVAFSSGLTVRTVQTLGASISVLYSASKPGIDNYTYEATCSDTTEGVQISSGAAILHRVFISSGTATDAIANIYDAANTGESVDVRIARVRGAAATNTLFDIAISSGITYELAGDGCWTFIYKRGHR